MAVSFDNDWFEEQIKKDRARETDYAQRTYGSPVTRAYRQQQKDVEALGGLEALRAAMGAEMNKQALSQDTSAGEERRFERMREELPTDTATPPPPRGGGGPSVSSVFAPLFDALDQQRRNAESRYSANAGQIQNIYGQIIGARSADIGDIEEAYGRLQQAAASRGESTLGKMAQREQQRQTENQATLQSMGVGDIGSATDDVAAEAAAVAQDVEMMNQSNWAGMLDAMGATSQEIARSDIASYGYRQGEDIARLQAAKEDYLQNVADQEFQLKFEEQQAKLAAAQAAAAAQARAEQAAAEAAAKGQEQQFEMSLDYIKTLPPIERAIGEEALYRELPPADKASVESAYNTFLANEGSKLGRMGMTAQEALAIINSPDYAGQLSQQAKSVLSKAVLYTFDQ